MDATKRAMMNVSGVDVLGFFERTGSWLIRGALKPVNALRKWSQDQKGRRALLSMSDHMLKDLGISRVDAIQYARKGTVPVRLDHLAKGGVRKS